MYSYDYIYGGIHGRTNSRIHDGQTRGILCVRAPTNLKIVGLMRSTRDNLPKFNIRLNCVAPYMTRTPLGDAIPGLWDDLERRGIPVQEPIWVARSVGTLIADKKFHGTDLNDIFR
jgi:NAD(P)-dependent dehydrogenase (short-subunit alcohol dehydrogenase family)